MKRRLRDYRIKIALMTFLLVPLSVSRLVRELSQDPVNTADVILASLTIGAVLIAIILLLTIKYCYWCGEELD